MELVDREKLIAQYSANPGIKGFMELIQDDYLIEALKKAEVIDAAHVVHGRWEPVYDEDDLSCGVYYRIANACSACKKTVGWIHDSYLYCPNCGAKMDLE